MYLSRIQLRLERLQPAMLQKWHEATSYAAHQWLWQLFPGQETRRFLFRQEPQARFFVLSETPPLSTHDLFIVETKPFEPRLAEGMTLDFQLRVNPVVSRNKQRCDVMMDAKYRAKAEGIAQEKWWSLQTEAACRWLEKQGETRGFVLVPPPVDDFIQWAGAEDENPEFALRSCVKACQQHRFQRRSDEKPVRYSSVDYSGTLRITDASRFREALYQGIGKCKALGCGLLMVKRAR